jgi:hypothetical protein
MLDQFEMRTEDMPTNMQALLRTYPRDTWDGCCQTNAHKSQFCSNLNLLGCAEATPLGKSGGAVQLEI